MRRLATTALAFALTLALAGCAGTPAYEREPSPKDDRRVQRDTDLTQGRALVDQRRYDQAIDEFVDAAGSDAGSQAVEGAMTALAAKMRGQRLPARLATAVEVKKRLPGGGSDERFHRTVETSLVDPFVKQAGQAQALLDDRRRFIIRMREEGEGDVMPTPADERALTEQEVAEAHRYVADLGMNQDIDKLFMYGQPLAAAMDRFLADDQRYLAQEEITEKDLDELGRSCEVLGEALWPVQRQLDRVRPRWR